MNADCMDLKTKPGKSEAPMNADYGDFQHAEITDKIIRAAYTVYNALGYGFTEKIYENAMAVEMNALGLTVAQQVPAQVFYKNQLMGDYLVDLLVEGKVILELKAVGVLTPAHEVQLVNYLRATGIEVGLLINFGPKIDIRRRAFTNPNHLRKSASKT
jgi:GxxExxY protein